MQKFSIKNLASKEAMLVIGGETGVLNQPEQISSTMDIDSISPLTDFPGGIKDDTTVPDIKIEPLQPEVSGNFTLIFK